MKVVILAGGLGTRLGEETVLRPKPMVEIGGYPIIWHIMKSYSSFGFNDFIILTGYLSHVIKDYFINYYTRYSDITVDMSNNAVEIHQHRNEPWKVTMLYTGKNTMTGGRIKKAQEYVGNERFMLTYGDGVSDININKLIDCHVKSGKLATLTAVQPAGRFGALDIEKNGEVSHFQEKPIGDGAWINGGFFVLEPEIFNYIPDNDTVMWEHEPMVHLTSDGQLNAYRHNGFWRPMDTMRDKEELNQLWASGHAPWKIWDNNMGINISASPNFNNRQISSINCAEGVKA